MSIPCRSSATNQKLTTRKGTDEVRMCCGSAFFLYGIAVLALNRPKGGPTRAGQEGRPAKKHARWRQDVSESEINRGANVPLRYFDYGPRWDKGRKTRLLRLVCLSRIVGGGIFNDGLFTREARGKCAHSSRLKRQKASNRSITGLLIRSFAEAARVLKGL